MKQHSKKQVETHSSRQTITRCRTNPRHGLTAEQVQTRMESGWSNEAVDAGTKTVGEIIKGNLLTYFNLVFAILAVLIIIAGSFRSLTFLPVVVANLLIGIIQELRAKRTLDKLSVLNAPKVTAVRDGKHIEIPSEELVVDDIVVFQSGSQICADAVVVGGAVTVNESLLTGETDEISKRPGDELLSGSFVVSGECLARLDKVGADSYISKLTLEAKAMNRDEQSEMIRVLDRLVGVVGIIIVPIGIALFLFRPRCVPGQHRIHGGGGDRHDPGGAVSACQRCAGGKRHAAGETKGAGP